MYAIRFTKNRGNQLQKCAITSKTINPQAMDEERCRGENKLDSLEKENERMENSSGTE